MHLQSGFLCFFLVIMGGLGSSVFYEETEPVIRVGAEYIRTYPVFTGNGYDRNSVTERELLNIQKILKVNRTLYIGDRDALYQILLDSNSLELKFQKKFIWRSNHQDINVCRMKGKQEDECRNFIKVLLLHNGTLFACGTNAFNPMCADYSMETFEQVGETISGMARCPYDPKHGNVALFADGMLFTATVTDFLAIDAVLYRSLGERPALRSVKHDSKWFKDPYFVDAVEWKDHVYFFFRETAVEFNYLERVIVSRVARICKNDMGGSQRVLEKQFTSFLKAQLNCSVPGESHFYFNVIQSSSKILNFGGRHVVIALFSTPTNSIQGSAVCIFDMDQLASTFSGRFKEQRNPDSLWTPVAEDMVPLPRPGCCVGPSMHYNSSRILPDEVLGFVKSHPLMEDSVPSLGGSPWITRTLTRDQLTHLVVDTACGIFGNETVLFLGSNSGIVLKYLLNPRYGLEDHLENGVLLEEIQTFPSDRCGDKEEHRWILGLEIDKESGSLIVAYTRCVVKVPLARCQRHNGCIKSCLGTQDPYCAWDPETNLCIFTTLKSRSYYEHDLDGTKSTQLGDCKGLITQSFIEDQDVEVSINMLVVSTVAAFVVGAVLSGLGVCLFSSQQNPNLQYRQKERDNSHMLDHSVNSVSRSRDLSHPEQDPLLNSLKQYSWNSGQANEKPIGIPPTPEQTPQQHKRSINAKAFASHLHESSFNLLHSDAHHFTSSNLPEDGLYESQYLPTHGEDSQYMPTHREDSHFLPLKVGEPQYSTCHGEQIWHFNHHYNNDSYCIPKHEEDILSKPLNKKHYVPRHRSNPNILSKCMKENLAQGGDVEHPQSSQRYESQYMSPNIPYLWSSSSEHRRVVSASTSGMFFHNFSKESPLQTPHIKRNLTFNLEEPPHNMTPVSDFTLMLQFGTPHTSNIP